MLGFEFADEVAPKPVAGAGRSLLVALQNALERFDDARIGAANDRGRAYGPAVHEAEKAVALVSPAPSLECPEVDLFALCGELVDLRFLALPERRGRDIELWPGEGDGGRGAGTPSMTSVRCSSHQRARSWTSRGSSLNTAVGGNAPRARRPV